MNTIEKNTRRVKAYTLLSSISLTPILKKMGYVVGFITCVLIASLLLLNHVTLVHVKGRSMNPTLHENDISITYKKPYEDLQENDIVYFEHNGHNVIHRIIDHKIVNHKLAYITKGDNNQHQTETVFREDYEGKNWKILKMPRIDQAKQKIAEVLENA